ncbi:hypothetical protein ABFV83_01395 [Lacrimispora sp. BS-2]|uniref:Uncharacterized protein n=1 Tax=Lacrimispora sp. BS-2 TaxID=3151850 RepID=A0AAU7PQD7_9FIRM
MFSMSKKVRKWSTLLMLVMSISMLFGVTAMASDDGKCEKALNYSNDNQVLSRANGYPSEVKINQLKVYPANVDTQKAYTDGYYTSSGPTDNQWLSTYIGSKTTQDYKKNNCNGFYIELYTSNYSVANRYEALDGNNVVKKGTSTWKIDFFVRTKYKTGDYDYARWEVDFYGTKNQGFPLYGSIYVKSN